ITAFVDVHGDLLYFAVVAFKDDFTGYVIDYGTFPEQRRAYFSKNDGGLETLARVYDGKTADGRVREGLCFLLNDLKTRCYSGEESGDFGNRVVNRVGVDAGWKPEIVEDSIRMTGARFAYPSKGAAISAKQKPMRLWPKRDGRVFGWHLLDEKVKAITGRQVLVDVNYWKTKVHESLSLTPGESGSLSLWGEDRTVHRMFSEHLSAETAKNVESGSNRVVEWSPTPARPDNHFFDCVVGCFAAASTLGLMTSDDPRRNLRVDLRVV
ncbi:MAG: phage terminase large subunit family protein, partial [Elusimicrobiales bacterium]|nr:phage terminase large subunit family protein [Elusimicrobiales bacterium]